MKACHSLDTYETDAIGDAKRIYEMVNLEIVHKELRNQSDGVRDEDVGRRPICSVEPRRPARRPGSTREV